MATNVTEKDKTLQEIIDWCEQLEIDGLRLANALLMQRDNLFLTLLAAGECSGSTSQTAVCSSVTYATKVGNYVTDADSKSSRTC